MEKPQGQFLVPKKLMRQQHGSPMGSRITFHNAHPRSINGVVRHVSKVQRRAISRGSPSPTKEAKEDSFDHNKTLETKIEGTQQDKHTAFTGTNEDNAIETLEEFKERIKGDKKKPLSGLVFQAVDFSSVKDLLEYNIKGSYFWGCTFPAGVTAEKVRASEAEVMENPQGIPFKPYRGFMYTQPELDKLDAEIYEHYLNHTDMLTSIAQSIHDYSIKDALYDYLHGKTVVSVMGGHAVKRSSPAYRQIVLLGRELAREGFLVCSGGGPGAMEATNLGAYLSVRPDDILDDVLAILQADNDKYEHEYQNITASANVIKKYGPIDESVASLGIPTWRYGHEPTNRFAAWVAKFFSNAIREDGLIAISNGGVIYTEGSAGTRQEIFQDACRNHYSPDDKCAPMIFLGTDFWNKSGVFPLVKATAEGRPYAKLLMCTDDINDIIKSVRDIRKTRNLPVLPFKMQK